MTFLELAAVSMSALQTLADFNIEVYIRTPNAQMCVQPL